MHHRLDFVAESRHADVEPFVAFAMLPENHRKYGIIDTGHGATVSTWHVDALVQDFFAAGNERLPGDVWLRRYGYDTSAAEATG